MTATLTRAANCVHWTADMMAELEACALADRTVTATSRRLGLSEETVARGALLLLRRKLQARGVSRNGQFKKPEEVDMSRGKSIRAKADALACLYAAHKRFGVERFRINPEGPNAVHLRACQELGWVWFPTPATAVITADGVKELAPYLQEAVP